jgi:MSHA biogenesis protein MshJ
MKMQFTLPAGLQSAMTRFDAMSLRERVLIGSALIACLLVIWDSLLMQPLNKRRASLIAVLERDPAAMQSYAPPATDGSVDAAAVDQGEMVTDPDPIGTALQQRESLRARLNVVNQQLQKASAALIAPARMSDVLTDVLRQQPGVTLISLHNKPVSSLAPPPPTQTDESGNTDGAQNANASGGARQRSTGPYLHPVELVIEGRYLDILSYLQMLEALPWRLNWQSFELDGTRYPLNRARIEISTLSLDSAWLGT